jgi:hypothetical protein
LSGLKDDPLTAFYICEDLPASPSFNRKKIKLVSLKDLAALHLNYDLNGGVVSNADC